MMSTNRKVNEKGSEGSDHPKTTSDPKDTSQQSSVPDSDIPPRTIKLLENYKYKRIDGINYICVLETEDITEVLPLVRDLNLRDDDVIMAGFPKSGNHWVFEIINMIQHNDANFVNTLMADCFMEARGTDVQRKLDEMPSPRVLGTHFRAHRLPKQILQKKTKIIYPLRNPKDVTVSMYSMISSITMDGFIYKASFDEFFDQYIEGEFIWGPWFEHVLAMEKFMKEHPDHPVFIFSYERMKISPVDVLKELCAFLGKSDDIVEEIARVTEMKNMKEILMSGKEGEFLKDKIEPDGMFRKGIIGDWKERLTAEQSRAVEKLFEEKMAGSQLARLVKDYM